jgi:beta-N-acetylhexosaminidase
VLLGVDVLMRDQRDLLAGQRLGLVTNATGSDAQGRSTIDVLHADPTWKLQALFSPEHGIRGQTEAGEAVQSAVDRQTGLPIHSLYGDTTRPTPAMLRDVDTLVYDIQDIGARTYTYIATLLEVMRGAAAQKKRVVVLDRPNPIDGVQVEGTVLDMRFTSFVGPAPIAMRYGMTIGELGRWFDAHMDAGADLVVVPMNGWRRDMWFDTTGLGWLNPSPNLRSLSAATLYPGTVLFEGTNLSEGRGTDRPFEWVGAPWLQGAAWAEQLNRAGLPGVRFSAAERTPGASKHAGEACSGVLIDITDRLQVRPMALGVAMLAAALAVSDRVQITASNFDRLAGTDQLRQALQAGRLPDEIVASWRPALDRFNATREPQLLY